MVLDALCDEDELSATGMNVPDGQCVVTEMGGPVADVSITPCRGAPTIVSNIEVRIACFNKQKKREQSELFGSLRVAA